ncbi:septum formation initiator family protein [Candidatus Amesbacteria bacterium]|nr:septum formation initiator family protein [Candidatus Amesbacteria bacterium]
MKKNLLFIILIIFTLRSGYGIWKLWRTRSIVKDAQIRLEKTRLENQKLTQKLAEIQSEEFVEREAREKLGLGKPGETILILPDQITNHKSQITNQDDFKPNWRLWWDLYIRI